MYNCPLCRKPIANLSAALLYEDKIVDFCTPVCAVKWHSFLGPKPSAPRLLLRSLREELPVLPARTRDSFIK